LASTRNSPASRALWYEAADTISRVVVPAELIDGRVELLAVGQAIEVVGEVRDFPSNPTHVATELRVPSDRMH
jgi:hypothetical protein